MTAESGVQKGMAFRGAVGGYLEASGLPVSSTRKTGQSISDVLRDEAFEHGHIRGLRDWVVNCRVGSMVSAGESADQAKADAEADGKRFAAVVWQRRAHKVGDSFVLMTLKDFSDFLHEHGDQA